MKIISRYILKQFVPIVALSLFAFVGLYLIIDFFEKIDVLLERQIDTARILSYFLMKIPLIVTQGIPMAVLLASLIALGLLKRNRELVALETAGINPLTYVAPILAAATVLSLLHFTLGETVAHSLNHRAQQFMQQEVMHRKHALTYLQENVWYRGQEAIFQIRFYDRQKKTLEKVSLFYLDPEFKLTRRIDARSIRWEERRWVASEGIDLKFNGLSAEQTAFSEMVLGIPETPADFDALDTVPEDLGWFDLYQYTQKIRQEGYNPRPYEVDLHQRITFPLTSIILALLGITIALRQGIHVGIATGVGLGMIIAFLYFAVMQVGCALATAGILPVIVGVWAANGIFFTLTVYLWIFSPR